MTTVGGGAHSPDLHTLSNLSLNVQKDDQKKGTLFVSSAVVHFQGRPMTVRVFSQEKLSEGTAKTIFEQKTRDVQTIAGKLQLGKGMNKLYFDFVQGGSRSGELLDIKIKDRELAKKLPPESLDHFALSWQQAQNRHPNRAHTTDKVINEYNNLIKEHKEVLQVFDHAQQRPPGDDFKDRPLDKGKGKAPPSEEREPIEPGKQKEKMEVPKPTTEKKSLAGQKAEIEKELKSDAGHHPGVREKLTNMLSDINAKIKEESMESSLGVIPNRMSGKPLLQSEMKQYATLLNNALLDGHTDAKISAGQSMPTAKIIENFLQKPEVKKLIKNDRSFAADCKKLQAHTPAELDKTFKAFSSPSGKGSIVILDNGVFTKVSANDKRATQENILAGYKFVLDLATTYANKGEEKLFRGAESFPAILTKMESRPESSQIVSSMKKESDRAKQLSALGPLVSSSTAMRNFMFDMRPAMDEIFHLAEKNNLPPPTFAAERRGNKNESIQEYLTSGKYESADHIANQYRAIYNDPKTVQDKVKQDLFQEFKPTEEVNWDLYKDAFKFVANLAQQKGLITPQQKDKLVADIKTNLAKRQYDQVQLQFNQILASLR